MVPESLVTRKPGATGVITHYAAIADMADRVIHFSDTDISADRETAHQKFPPELAR